MRSLMLVLGLCVLCLGLQAAGDAVVLPFKVKLGGHEAKPDKIFAKIADVVSSDALLEVDSKEAMIIVNIFACDEKGTVSGGAPKVLVIQGKNSAKLDETMDKSKLEAGTYIMNIVAGGATARVLFTVK